MLDGFARSDVTYDGATRVVYRAGSGPAVIVMHEMPGLHAGVIAFARRVIAAGMTVYMPSLIGEVGELAVRPRHALAAMLRACVSSEFATWASGKTSPIVSWLRALARDAHRECGGPGVGAVGMCLTGGFALAMMVDPHVVAPVLSQPSLPLPTSRKARRDLGVSSADLVQIRARAAAGTCVMGLRFTHDRLVPAERFARLREELGDKFIAIEIDSGPGNPHGISRTAHSVLGFDYVDDPEHPTYVASERVIAFFRERLSAS